ncbi:MAG TPA: penicillin acylase family protein [Opitutaceae bacterium]|nr:penicillin acylase family protein [Opitutaceae bacterium]
MKPGISKWLRRLVVMVGVLALLAVAGGGWFYSRVRASLPVLEGAVQLPRLSASVTIARDTLGVPTVRGANRLDVARALGWLHAQERFFQMDLLRRQGAGELAELFGKEALPLDRTLRVHGFRELASRVFAQLSPGERARLEAYAAGANAGLAALGEKPFEYLVLRETPRPWRPEDSLLVGYAMMLDLQRDSIVYERSVMTLRDKLGREALDFFAPLATPADAAIDGTTAPLAAIPSARVIDLRRKNITDAKTPPAEEPRRPGSNSFALAGAHTANGAALLANDMHLALAVPNIWYRASLEWPEHKITGVTLPGTPIVIAGSNGRIAWGFTNAGVDTSDLVVVEVRAGSPSLYTVPGHVESQMIETRNATIAVKGADPVVVPYQWTVWGPVIGYAPQQRPLALRWTAHDPSALNVSLGQLEEAGNVREAIEVAHRAGIPAQNFLVADSTGEIAWTIAGRLPKRVGYDGRLPVSWAFGDRRWDGFLPEREIPAEVGPASGRLWTANQRVVGGAALAKLGDGGYDRPARAAQIRDRLATLEKAGPKDLLALQLDDRALFLERWQKLLLAMLTTETAGPVKKRAELRELVAKWEGRAGTESVSYRLVREFRRAVATRALDPIFQSCAEEYSEFNWRRFQYEEALWQLLHDKPAHLLNPEFQTWDALLVAAVNDVTAGIERENVSLARATWGQRNTLRILHPFSYALPAFLTRWLNLPAVTVPGDSDMPRLQAPDYGASERFVVAPGRESEGIFQMPGGQSGHPLSPYFRAGHEAWVTGEPAPFLPGKTAHTLTLNP